MPNPLPVLTPLPRLVVTVRVPGRIEETAADAAMAPRTCARELRKKRRGVIAPTRRRPRETWRWGVSGDVGDAEEG